MDATVKENKSFINLGIVKNSKRQVLMIRRKVKETGKDQSVLEWAFPGGKQRMNEGRKACVEREILDETGYKVESTKELNLRMHPQFPVFVVYHLCKAINTEPITEPNEPHEVAEIRWVPFESVRSLVTSDLDKTVAAILEMNA